MGDMRLIYRLSPLNRFYVASSLGYIFFWVALAVPYLTYRQVPLSTILFLLSAYNIVASLLEYPTGVWADVYGYKKAIILGFGACTVANIVFLLPGGIIIPILGMGMLALGVSFISGSDYGLLNGLEVNQKKAIANYKFIADMTIFASAFLSGWLYNIDHRVPFVVSIVLCVFGAVVITTVPEDRVRQGQGNIFSTAKLGLTSVRDSHVLLGLTLLFTIIYGIAICIKYIFGSLSVLFTLQPEILGMVVGIGAFIRAWGAKVYSRKDFSFSLVLGILAVAVGLAGWWSNVYAVIVCLLAFQLVVGFFIAKIDHQFQLNCQDSIRASVFSFRKLSSRLFSSLYLLIFSAFLSRSTFGVIMTFSAIGIILTYLIVRPLLSVKTTARVPAVVLGPDPILE